MTVTEKPSQPTYGNLRRPRKAGLNSLSMASTVLLFTGLIGMLLLSLSRGMVAGLIWLLVSVVGIALLQARDADGLTLPQRLHRRGAFRRGRQAGWNLYRSGLLGWVPARKTQLPGLLAQTELAEGWDSYGRRFAVIHYPSVGDYVAVVGVEPDGNALVDQWEINSRVAHWGAMLASFGDEPGLQTVAVTIETAPDTGHRLRRTVEQRVELDSPPIAQEVLGQIVTDAPSGGAATIRGYVAFTFGATPRPGATKRTTEEVVRDLAARLPKLSDRLAQTGAGAVRPVDAAELCEVVRAAYDPAAADIIEAARAQGDPLDLRWDEVGPVAQDAQPTYLSHEGAVSVTWGMVHPPRGVFQSNLLADLLAPNDYIARKRVTLIYETLPADKAAKVVQDDINATATRATGSGRPSARIRRDAAIAEKTAEEEAAGAGVVNIGMLVTATVVDPGLQPGQKISRRNRNRNREERIARAADDAIATVDSLSSAARIRLRKQIAQQDAAFAAALPLGANLNRHMALPEAIREAL